MLQPCPYHVCVQVPLALGVASAVEAARWCPGVSVVHACVHTHMVRWARGGVSRGCAVLGVPSWLCLRGCAFVGVPGAACKRMLSAPESVPTEARGWTYDSIAGSSDSSDSTQALASPATPGWACKKSFAASSSLSRLSLARDEMASPAS
jgi:hypothetical protein